MARGQEIDILNEVMRHAMLKPNMRGIAQQDEFGNMVYDTGDVINAQGKVERVGSQLRDHLSELPDNQQFKRLAKRGKFSPASPLGMLGAPGIGQNGSSLSPFDPATAAMPDIGASTNRIKRTLQQEQRDDAGNYDERGRRKTFGTIGSGPLGMPAPAGPLAAGRMPYQDVVSRQNQVANEALANIPGVTLSDGSLFSDGTPREQDLSPDQLMEQQIERAKKLMTVGGDRSVSVNPKTGTMSLGAPPRQSTASPKPPNMKTMLQQAMMQNSANTATEGLGSITGQAGNMLGAVGANPPDGLKEGFRGLLRRGVAGDVRGDVIQGGAAGTVSPQQPPEGIDTAVPSPDEIQAAAGGNLTPAQIQAVQEEYKRLQSAGR